MGRCNTCLEFTGRSFKAQSFSWTLIEAQRYPGQRAPQGHGELTNVPAQRGDDRRCVFAVYFDQDGKTRMPFHQGCDVTLAGAAEQIALPMPGNGAVFNFCRPFPDGDGIGDLTSGLSVSPRVP
jgi:hypothetical protein